MERGEDFMMDPGSFPVAQGASGYRKRVGFSSWLQKVTATQSDHKLLIAPITKAS